MRALFPGATMSEPNTEPCPFCGELIRPTAERCRFCGEYLDDEEDRPRPRRRRRTLTEPDEGVRWLIPIDRSGWSIAAGYLGLLACLPLIGLLFGILALVTGMLALSHLKRNPDLGGQGRAIFGLVAGSLGALANAGLLVALLIDWLKHH
jgi:hypothetical protein